MKSLTWTRLIVPRLGALALLGGLLGLTESIRRGEVRNHDVLSRQVGQIATRFDELHAALDKTASLADSLAAARREATQAKLALVRASQALVRSNEELERQHARRRLEETLSRDLLAPSVQIFGASGVGSGTLVYSGTNEDTGAVESLVLTAWHVVRDILSEPYSGGRVSVAVYGPSNVRAEYAARVVASNPRIDTALLTIQSEEIFPHTAILSESVERRVDVWDAVYLVGCPLGTDPHPTGGSLSSKRSSLSGGDTWMIDAPGFLGNSGGGVFLAETHELIGVYSKIHTYGDAIIPHMGLITPMPAILDWLREEGVTLVLAPGNETKTVIAQKGSTRLRSH